jgi:RNA-directed DNA polymerase
LGPFLLRLLRSQNGRCPLCGSLLLHADQQPQSPAKWEQWLTALRKAIRRTAITAPEAPTDATARCLMHTDCARRHHVAGRRPALLADRTPTGACLSRVRGNSHARF